MIVVKYLIVLAQKTVEENSSDSFNVNMDWRQTSNSITLFYQSIRDFQGICYQLQRLNDSKLIFKLIFEKHIISDELELIADVEWPPICKRDFDTMQVNYLKSLCKNKIHIYL